MEFPESFLWGAAASSYQIEGTPSRAGGGKSIWDAFCSIPGSIWRGQTGEYACDHYRLMESDVELIRRLGLQAYRFSVSWPRILPEGTGRIHHTGLDFYKRLCDKLLEQGVQPWVTLFHWDYPYELFVKGGWMNPDSPYWFQEFAHVMGRALGDRASHWITLNEPQCFVKAHGDSTHAPGLRLDIASMVRIIHHVLLSHGYASQALKSSGDGQTRIGYAPVGITAVPVEQSRKCLEAARAFNSTIASFSPREIAWNNPLWLDPVIFGRYPERFLSSLGEHLPPGWEVDLERAASEIDFLGLNIYHGQPIDFDGSVIEADHPRRTGEQLTAMGWPVTPEALYWGPKLFYEAYGKPIYITENGISCRDMPTDSHVHDPQRIEFIRRYLIYLHRAVEEGIPVKGYFHWSLMDNFEWAEGYKERFGLIYVDFQTQHRMIKDSGYYYQQVIESRGKSLEASPHHSG